MEETIVKEVEEETEVVIETIEITIEVIEKEDQEVNLVLLLKMFALTAAKMVTGN